MSFEFLTTVSQLHSVSRILLQEDILAIDTESNSRHRYPERVCLIQVATKNKVYLIDPLAISDLESFGKVLVDPTIMKVLQGSEYDIRCLDREWGFRIRNLFDTQLAARFVGMRETGLAALTEHLLGLHIPKHAYIQKSDWSQRPLNKEALQYAAADVWHLIEIQRSLASKLEILARSSWISEEFARLEAIRYAPPDPKTAFLSVKGSQRLTGQEKAILRRLFQLREAEAKRRNRPPYYVLPHETLIYLATTPLNALSKLSSLGGPIDPRFDELIRATIHEGLSDPPIVDQVHHYVQPITPIANQRLKVLKQWRNKLGKRLSLDPALVWPMKSLERLAKAPLTLPSELDASEVRNWQRQEFATSLQSYLD